MSKRKHGQPSQPVTFYGPPDWVPIARAFFRIVDCLGSRALAARDLNEDLLTGRLHSVIRAFDQCGIEVKTGLLDREFWRRYVVREPLPTNMPHPVSWFSPRHNKDEFPFTEAHIFVRSAQLDCLYPATMSGFEQTPNAGIPRRETRGKKSDPLWEEVLIVGADLMVRNRYESLADLKNAVYEHFREKWEDGGKEDTQMREHLSPLFTTLKAALDIV